MHIRGTIRPGIEVSSLNKPHRPDFQEGHQGQIPNSTSPCPKFVPLESSSNGGNWAIWLWSDYESISVKKRTRAKEDC